MQFFVESMKNTIHHESCEKGNSWRNTPLQKAILHEAHAKIMKSMKYAIFHKPHKLRLTCSSSWSSPRFQLSTKPHKECIVQEIREEYTSSWRQQTLSRGHQKTAKAAEAMRDGFPGVLGVSCKSVTNRVNRPACVNPPAYFLDFRAGWPLSVFVVAATLGKTRRTLPADAPTLAWTMVWQLLTPKTACTPDPATTQNKSNRIWPSFLLRVDFQCKYWPLREPFGTTVNRGGSASASCSLQLHFDPSARPCVTLAWYKATSMRSVYGTSLLHPVRGFHNFGGGCKWANSCASPGHGIGYRAFWNLVFPALFCDLFYAFRMWLLVSKNVCVF